MWAAMSGLIELRAVGAPPPLRYRPGAIASNNPPPDYSDPDWMPPPRARMWGPNAMALRQGGSR